MSRLSTTGQLATTADMVRRRARDNEEDLIDRIWFYFKEIQTTWSRECILRTRIFKFESRVNLQAYLISFPKRRPHEKNSPSPKKIRTRSDKASTDTARSDTLTQERHFAQIPDFARWESILHLTRRSLLIKNRNLEIFETKFPASLILSTRPTIKNVLARYSSIQAMNAILKSNTIHR